ncbi:MAG: hypothetical protein HRU28_13925 [Rhizobiales bacterium]|nr:hypothetical protein [Hyphomicrobiales bacterium]
MKHLFVFLRYFGVVIIVLFGFTIVVVSIFKDADWSWLNLNTDSKIGAFLRSVGTEQANVIQNFVLFKNKPYKKFEVVTGIQYLSSNTQKIDIQWCYLSSKPNKGNAALRIQLADIDNRGVRIITPFTSKALRQFELTKSVATTLVSTHCRFQ